MRPIFDLPITSVPVLDRPDRFPVRRVYCVGRNYLDHIREMAEGDERDPPFFFQKPSDAVVAGGGDVPYPTRTGDFQFEGELVLAIGMRCSNIAAERAFDVVFGFAAGIDLTRRDRQRECGAKGWPWEAGKAFDHSAPCGSIVQYVDGMDIEQRALTVTVNGQERQNTTFRHMIWRPAEIISKLSADYVLAPGDLIYTGTPAGVGPVTVGDSVAVTVDGLPPLTITIVEGE